MENAGSVLAEVKEMFAETNRQIAGSKAEFDRQMAESKAEFDRQMAESRAEDDRRRAEDDRRRAEERVAFDRRMAEEAAARAASAAAFDRRMAEEAAARAASTAAFERKMAEEAAARAELEAAIKNTHENINGISDSNGMLAQEYFFNALKKKLTFAGVHFDDAKDWLGGRRKKRGCPTVEDQFDIVLVNKAAVAILEVKHRARAKDVDRLVDVKLKSFKYLYDDIYGNRKVYLGVAAMTFEDGVLEAAKEQGVGIIRQVGETVEEEGAWEVTAH